MYSVSKYGQIAMLRPVFNFSASSFYTCYAAKNALQLLMDTVLSPNSFKLNTRIKIDIVIL